MAFASGKIVLPADLLQWSSGLALDIGKYLSVTLCYIHLLVYLFINPIIKRQCMHVNGIFQKEWCRSPFMTDIGYVLYSPSYESILSIDMIYYVVMK